MNEMLVSRDQFKKALDMFIDKAYTPKVPKSEYLMYYGKLAIMNALLARHWGRLADENGMVNVNDFYEQYSRMFEHTDVVEIQGFTLDKNDLNELFGYIKAQSPIQSENIATDASNQNNSRNHNSIR